MTQHKHIFFDLDHTLWDFEANSREALSEIYEAFQLSAKGVGELDDYLERYRAINDECWGQYRIGNMPKEVLRTERFRRTLKVYGVEDQELVEKLASEYIRTSPFKTNLIDGTIEVLEYLKAKDYPLHILTNGFEEVQHIKMDRSGLKPYFENVITSEQVGVRKPDERAFLEAASIAQAEKEHAAMIGDNLEVDVLGAKRVGIKEVFFNPYKVDHNEDILHEVHHLTELKNLF